MIPVQETLELLRKSLGAPNGALSEELRKSISVSTGLTAYDLQAPAKNLYPVNTPLRNRLPRVGGGTGPATNWKVIQGITGSGVDTMGWVPEGQRAGRMSYSSVPKAASYASIGEEDQVSFEAISAGVGFEDVRATGSMRCLQKMMLKEEMALMGGNNSLALGTTNTPTLAATGTGKTLPAATYSVICVALTCEGFRASSLANGLPTSATVTGADGNTFALAGGTAKKSANATQAITLGQQLECSTAPKAGAYGYAWYVGTAGAEKLEAITTINSAVFSAPLLGTGQPIGSLTNLDKSTNSIAFDGLLTVGASGVGAYFNTLATGAAGVGTKLTSSGRGSVIEIDAMLRSMWDQYQVSPTVIWVNSQELKTITDLCLTGASGPLVQYFANPQQGIMNVAAGGGIEFYFNPFGMNGGTKVPIMLHPSLPPGTVMAFCERLPEMYQSNETPNTAEVKLRRDYYQIDWPLRTRQQEFSVYAEEVLAVYAPFCIGIITNIAP